MFRESATEEKSLKFIQQEFEWLYSLVELNQLNHVAREVQITRDKQAAEKYQHIFVLASKCIDSLEEIDRTDAQEELLSDLRYYRVQAIHDNFVFHYQKSQVEIELDYALQNRMQIDLELAKRSYQRLNKKSSLSSLEALNGTIQKTFGELKLNESQQQQIQLKKSLYLNCRGPFEYTPAWGTAERFTHLNLPRWPFGNAAENKQDKQTVRKNIHR